MNSNKPKRRWLRISSLSVIVLAAFLGALLVVLPFILQYAAVKHLVSSNLQDTAIKNIDINLFTGHFQIDGFSASQSEYRHLYVDRFNLHFEWLPAFNKTIHFKSIEVEALDINVQQTENGQLIFGYEKSNASKPINDETVIEKYVAEQAKNSEPWHIVIDEFKLTNSQLVAYNREAKTRVQLKFDIFFRDLQADSEGNLRFDNLSVENLEFYLQDELTTQWTALSIDTFALKNNQLAVTKVALTDLVSTLTRFSDGNLLVSELARQFVIPDSPEKSSIDKKKTKRVEKPFTWQLGDLTVEGDSRITLTDQSFSPALKRKIIIDSFSISGINSQKAANKTTVDIAFSSTMDNEITINGDMAPLLDKPEVDFQFNFRQINLTDLSPYVAQATGYTIQTGILNLEGALKIADNQIKIDNQLQLHKLDVRLSNAENAAAFNKKMTLPLGTALNILQDGEGNISLSVPVDGSLNDPNFHLGSAINFAVAKSLKAASLSYLKYAIQPWGAALFLGEKLTDRIGRLGFEPVIFEPGVATIGSDTKAYLDKLAELLTKKGNLTITACPITSPRDKNALQKAKRKTLAESVLVEQLNILADARYRGVKNYLSDQHQIAGKRIIKCLTEHRDMQDASGAVELRL